MPFTKLYYHAIWSTKHRAPVITPEIEPLIFQFLTRKIHGLGGHLFAINGVSDHVHLVLSIPVTVSVSKFIGQIKAVASTKINKVCFEIGEFKWQRGYSIFSISEKELKYYIRYVDKQKSHHAEGNLQSDLKHLEQENC